MLRVLLLILLLGPALSVHAQRVVKCTQADGSVAYQQTSCDDGDEQIALDVEPQMQINTPEKRYVQTYDPYSGQVTGGAWIDVRSSNGGPTYTTREMRQVNDPYTGQVRNAWVDVPHPVQQAPAYRRPSAPPMAPRVQSPQPSYYQPSDRERRRNSSYESAGCKMLASSENC